MPLAHCFTNMVKLFTQLFSFKKGSMRSLRWHRLITVCWVFPLFIILSLWNNIGLALDWLLFPSFRHQPVERPVFVVSLPRTGTTNLLHGLTDSGMPFTALSLWESLIAPAVVQKKLLRFLWKGFPLAFQQMLRKADAKLFKQLNIIHKASLFCKEEDELALLWSLSTAYLGFFYPESDVFRDLYRFDQEVSVRRKARIMKRYKRLAQRHLYALPPDQRRRFLAKNPLMPYKVKALASEFPDATAVIIERDPKSVFPSGEVLLLHLLDFATDVPLSQQERHTFIDLIEDFQHHLYQTLAVERIMPTVLVPFKDLIKDRNGVLSSLVQQLGEKDFELSTAPEEEHHTPARYRPWTQEELNTLLRQPWPNWPSAMWLQRVPKKDQETGK
jgi:omega-hydroxy-beta-dihydromenaquinone-9 sulfotransferase